jgi:hypothetical protein
MTLKNKIALFVILFLLVSFTSIFALWRSNWLDNSPRPKKTMASDTDNALTSKTDWQAGTYSSDIDLDTSDGSAKLNLSGTSKIDLEAIYNADNSKVTAQMFEADRSKVIDKDIATSWGGNVGVAVYIWWKIDMGESKPLAKLRLYTPPYSYPPVDQLDTQLLTSTDDVTYTDRGNGDNGGWQDFSIVPVAEARYIKLIVNQPPVGMYSGDAYIFEVEAYQPLSATHTSAPTQITNTNLYQWQTFTPTYTAPANTTVSFRLRTSTDSSNWTDWTAYQTPASAEALDISSLVTSSTGDAGSETFYKYIQVETRLTSSDGVSTPTVDSYSIGYHTNVPPNKPTGATATVRS